MTTDEPEWVPGDIVKDAHGRVAYRRKVGDSSDASARVYGEPGPSWIWCLIGGGVRRFKEDEDFARPLTVIYKADEDTA